MGSPGTGAPAKPSALSVGWGQLWLEIKELGLRRFESLFPFTKGPFWVHLFEPLPVTSGSGVLLVALAQMAPNTRSSSREGRIFWVPHFSGRLSKSRGTLPKKKKRKKALLEDLEQALGQLKRSTPA